MTSSPENPPAYPSPALLTDKYELTMLDAALADGTAHRRCTFEVFARSLPHGRRYGVVAGVPRLLEAISRFTFDDAEVAGLRDAGAVVVRLGPTVLRTSSAAAVALGALGALTSRWR